MRRIAADAVILRKGSILLVKRKNAPFRGMLALPGGMLGQGETLEECVVRETREETGLLVRPTRLIGIYSSPKRDPRGTVSAVFACTVAGGRLKAGSDASSVQWVRLRQLPRLAFDHSKIVMEALKRGKQ
ncbi:MAG: NUDIX hydrolase [Candidatus Micrarchaeota archaeon]|nr:NUDIX hydrolase [Candidatus Micrarchaeota archaeon]